MAAKIALVTIGCKVNQFEQALMREQLVGQGFKPVSFDQAADVYVINTCSVTSRSDFQSRQFIRQAIKRNNSAYIVVTGCYAQLNHQRIKRIQGVDLILGNAEKTHIVHYLTDLHKTFPPRIIMNSSPENQPQISGFQSHTRAFVKIQDGCNQGCSYCIVPLARGRSRSLPAQLVKTQLIKLIEAGYKEIVLTGIHIGSYGRDFSPQDSLAGLLKQLIKLNDLSRIRLSSIEPAEFSDELMDVLQSEKICPHLHIPLQSAHPEQLKAMNRNYSPTQYQRLIERLVDFIPQLALGCDVIVGFPGETPDIFEYNYRFIEQLPLCYLHVFRYSPRPHTIAANLPQQVKDKIKLERSRRLRDLSRQKHLHYQQLNLGDTRPTLLLNKYDEQTGHLCGLTDNYLKIIIPPDKKLINKLLPVNILSMENGRLLGRVSNGS